MLLLSSLSAISDTFENVNMHTLTLSFAEEARTIQKSLEAPRNVAFPHLENQHRTNRTQ